MTEEQWKNARRGHFYRPRKRQITRASMPMCWIGSRDKEGLPVSDQRHPASRDADRAKSAK